MSENEGYEAKENDIINLVFSEDYKYKVLFESNSNTSKSPQKSLKRRSEEEMDEKEGIKKPKSMNEDKWDNIDSNKCLVFTSRGTKGSERIAAYDMDQTLIKTKSGRVFPISIEDWQLNLSEVPGKLKKLHENGFKIAVFTNQAGVEHNKITIPEVKKKIMMIRSRLDIPMQFFISTGSTKYRKPRIGW